MATSDTEWSVESALSSVGFNPSSHLALAQLAGRLKLVKRAGWKRFDIEYGAPQQSFMDRTSRY